MGNIHIHRRIEKANYPGLQEYLVKNSKIMHSPLRIRNKRGEQIGYSTRYEFFDVEVVESYYPKGAFCLDITGDNNALVKARKTVIEEILLGPENPKFLDESTPQDT